MDEVEDPCRFFHCRRLVECETRGKSNNQRIVRVRTIAAEVSRGLTLERRWCILRFRSNTVDVLDRKINMRGTILILAIKIDEHSADILTLPLEMGVTEYTVRVME